MADAAGALPGRVGVQLQRRRVDAVAQAARVTRAVFEDVAEVAAAAPADDLRAGHPVRDVAPGLHRLGHRGLGERRPAGPRLELRVRREQLRAAAGAAVHAVVVTVPVLAGERTLRPGLPEYGVLLTRELLSPLRVGLRDLSLHDSDCSRQAGHDAPIRTGEDDVHAPLGVDLPFGGRRRP